MNFQMRMNGQLMATVNIPFYIGLNTLVNAAMQVISFTDTTVDQLGKAAIERELRSGLENNGHNFIEFGHEMALHEAHHQVDAITAKVAELYNLPSH